MQERRFVWLGDILTVLAFAAFVMFAYYLRPGTRYSTMIEAGIAFAIGAGIFAIRHFLFPSDFTVESTEPTYEPIQPNLGFWWILTVIGGGLIMVPAYYAVQRFKQVPGFAMNVNVEFAIIVVAVLLIGFGLSGWVRGQVKTAPLLTWGWLLLIVIGGLALRVYQLGNIAFPMDEIHFTDSALWFIEGSANIFGSPRGRLTNTLLFPYWEAGTTELFGRNWTGMRMVASLSGTFMLIVSYFLVEALTENRRFALISTALLMTFSPFLHGTRMGQPMVAIDGLFGLMFVMFMIRGYRYNRRFDWAFGGVSLGLAVYGHEAGQLYYTALFFASTVAFVILFPRRFVRFVPGVVTVFIAAALVSAPLYYTIFGKGEPLFPRANDRSVMNLFEAERARGVPTTVERVARHVTVPVLAYFQEFDWNKEYNGGYGGLIHPWLVPTFLLGFVLLTLRMRRLSVILPIIMLSVMVGVSITDTNDKFSRYMPTLPFFSLTLTFGIYYVITMLTRAFPKRVQDGVLYTVVALIVIGQGYHHFVNHIPLYNEQRLAAIPGHDFFDAVIDYGEMPEPRYFAMITPYGVDYGRIRGLLRYFYGVDSYNSILVGQFENFNWDGLPQDRNLVFYIPPDDIATYEEIRRRYPNAQEYGQSDSPIPENERMWRVLVPLSGDVVTQ